MKKVRIILLIFVMFLLSGCGSDIECTNSYNENVKYDMKITADLSNDKVVNATARMKFKNSKDATNMCNLNKLLDLENVQIVCKEEEILIHNYQKIILANEKKSITKNEFIKILEKDGFKC